MVVLDASPIIYYSRIDEELCLTLLDTGYTPLTVYSYLTGKKKNNKLVVLRHDIDSGYSHHQ
ncbi:MAG TPA: hypothetical protein C5S37_01485 [Methanophagales archaeon]|nr:hypothetical protein [Methanophagales archaeon]